MAFPDTDLDVSILAYLGANPTDDPGDWPSPTDLSSRLLDTDLAITRGRSPGQMSLSSGSCTFDLDNTDGALTPLLATSAYYGLWDTGVPVAVDVDGVGSSPPYGRFRGYVADISQTIVPGTGGENNISAVRVTLGGEARQRTQGSVAKSAMRRYYGNVSPQPVAWWPLESGDRRGAQSFTSGLAGGANLVVAQSTFFGVTRPFSAAGGVTPGPLGAASATDTSAGGYLAGNIPVVSTATTARGEISFLADGFENTLAVFLSLRNPTVASDGAMSRIACAAQNFGGTWKVGVDWTGASATSSNYSTDAVVVQDNAWHHCQFDIASANGGADTSYSLKIDNVVIVSGTATGFTWNPPTIVWTNVLAVDLDEVAHLAVWSGASLPAASESYDAFLGHRGEAAHTRFARVCTEQAIPYSTTATTSHDVGPQPALDTVGILVDLESADHGMLYERIDDWGFGFLAASQRANLTAALTIDLSTYRTTGDTGNVLTPVRNDARLRNEWTISVPDGREATATDADHQARKGFYDDSAEVNLDATLDISSEAGWRVHEGTFDGPRYRTMPIDITANTASPSDLLTSWLVTELGDRIDRTDNPTPEHPHDDTTLILHGYTETLRRRSWKVQAVVEPYGPWDVRNYVDLATDGAPDDGRWSGDAAAAIRTAIDSDDLSIVFDPNRWRWTTNASHFTVPMRVRLKPGLGGTGGGELLTFSAIATTAATFVAAGAASHADNAAVTPAIYAGAAANDWICVLARIRGTAGSLATPTGYEVVKQFGNLYLFAKVHDGSETDPTITPSGGSAGDTVSAITFGLRGMPTTLDELADAIVTSDTRSNTAAQNIAFGGVYPKPQEGCVGLLLAGKSDDWTSVAVPTGWTEIGEPSTTTGSDQGLYLAYVIQTTAAVAEADSLVVTGGASAVSESMVLMLAGGYQTATVGTRSVNGVIKSHAAGTRLEIEDVATFAL